MTDVSTTVSVSYAFFKQVFTGLGGNAGVNLLYVSTGTTFVAGIPGPTSYTCNITAASDVSDFTTNLQPFGTSFATTDIFLAQLTVLAAGIGADSISLTQALGALNAIVSIALSGQVGCAFNLAAGTLAATLVPELSFDGGATWAATQFYDPASQSTAANVVVTNPNPVVNRTVILSGGAGLARVRVSLYTSGTANAVMRASASYPFIPATVSAGSSNVNVNAWGGAATTLGQKAMSASVPVTIASDQSTLPVSFPGGVTATQGTAAALAGAWPMEITDGTHGPTAVKAGSTAAAAGDASLVVALSPNSPIPTGANVIGAVTQSGTWTVQQGGAPWSVSQSGAPWSFVSTKSNNAGAPSTTNLGTLPALANAANPSWTEGNQVALSVDLTGAMRVNVLEWLGSTAPTVGSKTSANSIPVVIASDQGAVAVTFSSATVAQGNAGTNAQAWWTQIGDTSHGPVTVKAGSTAAAAADLSLVVALSPNSPIPTGANVIGAVTQSGTWTVTANQGGAPWTFTGTKTNNNAVPGATNVGTLPAIANAATQTWTEGDQVALSVDLSGAARINVLEWLGSTAPTVGSKTSANSIPVVIASDQGAISVNQNAAPWTFTGTKSNNAAAPGSTNLGVLPAIANAATQTWTEGDQVALSVDLSGILRDNIMEWGGSATTLGQKLSASSIPVVLASDSSLSISNTANANLGTTTAPTQGTVVMGQTSDLPRQYQPLPLSSQGLSLLVDSPYLASLLQQILFKLGEDESGDAQADPDDPEEDPSVTTVITEGAIATTVYSITPSTTGQALLGFNGNRKGATIFNNSVANFYVLLGKGVSTTNFSLILVPNAYYEVPYTYVGQIEGVLSGAASGTIQVTELY